MSFGKCGLHVSVNGGATGTLFWLQGARARRREAGGLEGWRLPQGQREPGPDSKPCRGQAAGVHEATFFQYMIICIENTQTQSLVLLELTFILLISIEICLFKIMLETLDRKVHL